MLCEMLVGFVLLDCLKCKLGGRVMWGGRGECV